MGLFPKILPPHLEVGYKVQSRHSLNPRSSRLVRAAVDNLGRGNIHTFTIKMDRLGSDRQSLELTIAKNAVPWQLPNDLFKASYKMGALIAFSAVWFTGNPDMAEAIKATAWTFFGCGLMGAAALANITYSPRTAAEIRGAVENFNRHLQ